MRREDSSLARSVLGVAQDTHFVQPSMLPQLVAEECRGVLRSGTARGLDVEGNLGEKPPGAARSSDPAG